MAEQLRAAPKGVCAYIGKGRFISPEQIDRALDLVKAVSESEGLGFALIGGVAMQAYGSPRLTKDVDFAVDGAFPRHEALRFEGPIDVGGESFVAPDGAKIDIILRSDEYAKFYLEAIENVVVTEDGIPIVTPDYLAAMEFAANDDKHLLDLKWLVKQRGLVDPQKVRNIVHRHVGGKYGVENLDKVVDQVRFEASRRPSRSDPSEYP